MGFFDAIKGFAKEYGPALLGGMEAYNTYSQNGKQGDYLKGLRAAEDRNYQDGLRNYEATKKYNAEAAAYSSRASAANAAARGATEKNRQEAAKKALGIQNKYSDMLMSLYRPYVDAGQTVLPQMTQAYGKGISNLDGLAALFSSPQAMSALNAKPALQQKINIPSYFAGGKK
jgi:biotin carboxyl carrier protein